jgi:pyruvate/2-oxoglutarate dehydrogenase complex dihydrolipoamide dehydrogenase (E3) component
MSSKAFDFLVLGGGSAGFNAARTAASLGKTVAIVDGARELGGLCILRGCMPSKTLLHAAEVLHHARKGKKFGLRIPEAGVDMKALHRWKRKVIAEFADYRRESMLSGKYTVFRSHGRFTGPRSITLDDGTILTARKILIATGSRVSVPDIPGLRDTPFWTSDDILDLDHVPESVIVLGGGIVACELAQFLRRIGSRVILIQRGAQLLSGQSADAAAVVQQAFRDEGMEVHTGTAIQNIAATAGGVRVRFTSGGKTLTRTAAHLFNALGRTPVTDTLDAPAAGVKLTHQGRIQVNRWQQTTNPDVYAGGDVCGPHDIVHLAVAQGELAARHAFGVKALRPVNPAHLLSVVFTDPPIARIGLLEADLTATGTPFLAASYPFNDHGKSILMDAMYGYVKVIADPVKGRLLGAEIAGAQAGELIHCFTGPLVMGATVFDLLRAPWYHPTLAEILTYPLEEIADTITGS